MKIFLIKISKLTYILKDNTVGKWIESKNSKLIIVFKKIIVIGHISPKKKINHLITSTEAPFDTI